MMAIEHADTIDFATIDESSGDLWLTISDHLPWEDSSESEHLLLLQNKLNSYLSFIESGEVYRKVKGAEGLQVVINLVGKFALSPNAQSFIDRAKAAIEGAGFHLQYRLATAN